MMVVERFRDEIGDWRVCLLTPFGARVHAPWAMALTARIREALGLEVQSIWSDDGIALHFPDADAPPPVDDLLLDADDVDDLVVGEVGETALFGARFRENAARALLIPRRRPDRRTPLWQQRLKAQALLQVARKYPTFPIVLETYRECLQDVFDLPALKRLLQGIKTRRLDLVDVETPSASPFSSSLLFDYIATYMYEDDTPAAERRAQALSLDRDLLRELLGQEELRELLDRDAVEQVEQQLRGAPKNPDDLHDLLRLRGDLRPGPVRRGAGGDAGARAPGDPGTDRRGRAADRGRGRRALPRRPRRDAAGRPARRVPRGRRAAVALARAAVREGARAVHDRRGQRPLRHLGGGRAAGARARGPARARRAPAGRERARVVRPGGPAPAAPGLAGRAAARGRAGRAADPRAASCPGWHGIDRRATVREALVPLQGLALPVALWESDLLPRRVPNYSPAWLDQLCASGDVVWVGAGLDRVAVFFRDDARALGRPPAADRPEGEAHDRIRASLGRSAEFWWDLLAAAELEPEDALPALWDLVWAGEVTNDAWAPLRSRRRFEAPRPRPTRRFSRRRSDSVTATQGRWTLTDRLFPDRPDRRALAELLLERHGIVTRDSVRAEGIPGGYGAVYGELKALETLGLCRRGYFVEGLGGAQFALGGAVERLRELRPREGEEVDALVLAAADPAQPYGAAIPWPKRAGARAARVAGAYVVLLGGEAVLFVERGGRTLVPLRDPDESWLRPALAALVEHVRRRRAKRLAVERFDGEPVTESEVMSLLVEAGFLAGPRRAVLRP